MLFALTLIAIASVATSSPLRPWNFGGEEARPLGFGGNQGPGSRFPFVHHSAVISEPAGHFGQHFEKISEEDMLHHYLPGLFDSEENDGLDNVEDEAPPNPEFLGDFEDESAPPPSQESEEAKTVEETNEDESPSAEVLEFKTIEEMDEDGPSEEFKTLEQLEEDDDAITTTPIMPAPAGK